MERSSQIKKTLIIVSTNLTDIYETLYLKPAKKKFFSVQEYIEYSPV